MRPSSRSVISSVAWLKETRAAFTTARSEASAPSRARKPWSRTETESGLITSAEAAIGRGSVSPAPDDPEEVEDDQDVDDEARRLERARLLDELVDLQRDEERGGDHGEPLGPPLPPPEAPAFDDLEHAVGQRCGADQEDLVVVDVRDPLDCAVDEATARVELEPTREAGGE